MLLMYKSLFDQLYVVFSIVLLPMSSPCGFAWILAAFLCCSSEILFHRMILELNAGNDTAKVETVLRDISRCKQKLSTYFSYVYLLALS